MFIQEFLLTAEFFTEYDVDDSKYILISDNKNENKYDNDNRNDNGNGNDNGNNNYNDNTISDMNISMILSH